MKPSPHPHQLYLVLKFLLEITKLYFPNPLSLPLKSQAFFSPWIVATIKPNIFSLLVSHYNFQ